MSVTIGELISKDNVEIEDEDLKFYLEVTAEWDNIIESLNKI